MSSLALASTTSLLRGPAIELNCHPVIGAGVWGGSGGGVLAGFSFREAKASKKGRSGGGGGGANGGTRADNFDMAAKFGSPLLLLQPLPIEENRDGDGAGGGTAAVIARDVIPIENNGGEDGKQTMTLGRHAVAMWDMSDPRHILVLCVNLRPMATATAAAESGCGGDGSINTSSKGNSGSCGTTATSTTTTAKTTPIQELLLLDATAFTVLSRVTLPSPPRSGGHVNSDAGSLAQTPRGTYVLAACGSARGSVRVYRNRRTETAKGKTDDGGNIDGVSHGGRLEFVGSFGEGVALHNFGVSWQSCFFLPRRCESVGSTSTVDEEPSEEWRLNGGTGEDAGTALAMSSFSSTEEERLADYLVVGIPHAHREPRDLRTSIYVWDPLTGIGALPALTIRAPEKSGGVAFLQNTGGASAHAGGRDRYGAHRFALVGHDGRAYGLGPTFETDWAGIMYPPGYRLVEKKLDYIEDEDELDRVIKSDHGIDGGADDDSRFRPTDEFDFPLDKLPTSHVGTGRDEEDDPALALALKRSLESSWKNMTINPFDDTDAALSMLATGPSFVSCRPELFLRSMIRNDSSEGDERAATEGGDLVDGTSDFLSHHFPQHNDVLKCIDENEVLRQYTTTTKCLLPVSPSRVPASHNTSSNASSAVATMLMPPPLPMPQPPVVKSVRGRRKTAFETLLQSCVDANISRMMKRREVWADGSGSRWMEAAAGEERGSSLEAAAASITCPACRGRMVMHRCGKREKPIDHESIALVERQRKEEEEVEKCRVRREKKRLADERHRESKKKRKKKFEGERSHLKKGTTTESLEEGSTIQEEATNYRCEVGILENNDKRNDDVGGQGCEKTYEKGTLVVNKNCSREREAAIALLRQVDATSAIDKRGKQQIKTETTMFLDRDDEDHALVLHNLRNAAFPPSSSKAVVTATTPNTLPAVAQQRYAQPFSVAPPIPSQPPPVHPNGATMYGQVESRNGLLGTVELKLEESTEKRSEKWPRNNELLQVSPFVNYHHHSKPIVDDQPAVKMEPYFAESTTRREDEQPCHRKSLRGS